MRLIMRLTVAATAVGRALAFVAEPSPQLLLIRHGRTEMNEHLSVPGQQWGARGFVDPGIYDTELTETGQRQARALNKRLRAQPDLKVDLLVSSPLVRALSTSELVFSGLGLTLTSTSTSTLTLS